MLDWADTVQKRGVQRGCECVDARKAGGGNCRFASCAGGRGAAFALDRRRNRYTAALYIEWNK
jgi:hypothetical protein